ncbi:hypothetical protein BC830DRAFT_1172599 [Chytriomyces sp. MP71]|nr:hypothetical protein BC830DRAFT_1172599 [Chytriomyces sp. MP71]
MGVLRAMHARRTIHHPHLRVPQRAGSTAAPQLSHPRWPPLYPRKELSWYARRHQGLRSNVSRAFPFTPHTHPHKPTTHSSAYARTRVPRNVPDDALALLPANDGIVIVNILTDFGPEREPRGRRR